MIIPIIQRQMEKFPIEKVLTSDPQFFEGVRLKLKEIGYTVSITGNSPVVDLLNQKLKEK